MCCVFKFDTIQIIFIWISTLWLGHMLPNGAIVDCGHVCVHVIVCVCALFWWYLIRFWCAAPLYWQIISCIFNWVRSRSVATPDLKTSYIFGHFLLVVVAGADVQMCPWPINTKLKTQSLWLKHSTVYYRCISRCAYAWLTANIPYTKQNKYPASGRCTPLSANNNIPFLKLIVD